MYEIKVPGGFSGAHRLRGYEGKCERLHGHNWKVEAVVESPSLNKIGMVIDFKILKKKLKDVLKSMDHAYLNEASFFKKNNPSAENIARHIYDSLKKSLKAQKVNLKNVSVWETDTSCATYHE